MEEMHWDRSGDKKSMNERLSISNSKSEINLGLPTQMICVIGSDGRIEKVNAISGRLLNRDLADFVHDEDVLKTRIEIQKLMLGETQLLQNFKVRCRTRGGSYRWWTWTAQKSEDSVLCIGRDETERDSANKELLETNQRLLSIFNGASDGILMQDIEGHILYMNEAAAKFYGFHSAQEAIDQGNMTNAIHVRLIDENYNEISLSDLPGRKVFATGDAISDTYVGMINKDSDKLIWSLVSAMPIFDGKSKVRFVVSIFRDMSGQLNAKKIFRQEQQDFEDRVSKRTQELAKKNAELFLSQNFLDSVIENIPDMIFVKDAAELRLIRLNRAGEKIMGFSKEEIIGKSDYDLFTKEQADEMVARDREVFKNKIVCEIAEERVQTKYGVRLLHTKKIPLFDEDSKPQYLLGIAEDITDKKKSEQQAEALIFERSARLSAEDLAGRLRFLSDASQALSSSLDYTLTLSKLARLVVPKISDWCSIDVLEPGDQYPRSIVVENPDPIKLAQSNELAKLYPTSWDSLLGVASVFRTGKSELYPEISEEQLKQYSKDADHFKLLKALGMKSVMIVALKSSGRVFGVVRFVSSNPIRIYNQADLQFAERRAGNAAVPN